MKFARLSTGVILILVGVPLRAQTQQQAQPTQEGLTLTGKLVRAMAMGGESTGWVLELESPARIDGKLASAIQVDYGKTDVLEELANKRVRVSGELTHRHGVETGEQPVLKASSIREAKTGARAPGEPKSAFKLVGTEWRLADLAGAAVLEHTQPTLAFPEAGRVAGNDSCNRFSGTAEVKRDTIKLGSLASTRMACPDAVMNQETKYLQALQTAEHFEWQDPYLIIRCKGFDKPLRFVRMPADEPAKPRERSRQ